MTLLADPSVADGVTLAFTERGGGVSAAPYASLNLGALCGDAPENVTANRQFVLDALGVGTFSGRLINPRQVHGTTVVRVRSAEPADLLAAQEAAAQGADAVVCTAEDVPVMLCFADCVPVVLVASGGFAVAHSGWRGTIGRIAAVAARALCEETGASPQELLAYVGPHVGAADYEVSEELAAQFAEAFGKDVIVGERNLDLSAALAVTFAQAGIPAEQIAWCTDSTASCTDRFFSYRAEDGHCGRHAAVAVLRSGERGAELPVGWVPADKQAVRPAADCAEDVLCEQSLEGFSPDADAACARKEMR